MKKNKVTFFDKETKKQIEISPAFIGQLQGGMDLSGTHFSVEWGYKSEEPGTYGNSRISLEDFVMLSTTIDKIDKGEL